MSESWQEGIKILLRQSNISFLATQGRHGPESSMAPFAIHEGDILLHLSKLAAHTMNIENSAAIGLMICTPETEADSPLALPRLSLQGEATPVTEDGLEAAKAAYLSAIPYAESLFGFGDFRLFKFKPESIHWVGGFGRARKVTQGQWYNITLTP